VDCFKRLPSTFQKTLAIRSYYDLFEPQSFWYNNVLAAFVEIIFLCYVLFAYDLYLDFDLIHTYQEQGRIFNENETMVSSSEEKIFTLLKGKNEFERAVYASYALIIPSLMAFFLMTWCQMDIPERLIPFDSTSKFRKPWRFILGVIKPFLFIGTFVVRYIRASTEPNNVGRGQRYDLFFCLRPSTKLMASGIGMTILHPPSPPLPPLQQFVIFSYFFSKLFFELFFEFFF
jgi:hypothetical protein